MAWMKPHTQTPGGRPIAPLARGVGGGLRTARDGSRRGGLGGPLWRARRALLSLWATPARRNRLSKGRRGRWRPSSRRRPAPPPLPLSGSRGGGEVRVLRCNDLRDRSSPVSPLNFSG